GGLLDLPHGECNSILLEHIIRMNFETVPGRYRDIARQLGLSVDNVSDHLLLEMIIDRIVSMRENLNIPSRIKVATLEKSTLDYLVNNALNDPCMVTNPRVLTKEEVRIIYGRVLQSQE
ncbi:MAG: alcohol dehydrogenase, partial [Firmicutes bacterium HGW-Firmicutes-6]